MKRLRDKLTEQKLPVSQQLWADLESRLDKDTSGGSRKPVWYWLSGIAAAVLLLVLVGSRFRESAIISDTPNTGIVVTPEATKDNSDNQTAVQATMPTQEGGLNTTIAITQEKQRSTQKQSDSNSNSPNNHSTIGIADRYKSNQGSANKADDTVRDGTYVQPSTLTQNDTNATIAKQQATEADGVTNELESTTDQTVVASTETIEQEMDRLLREATIRTRLQPRASQAAILLSQAELDLAREQPNSVFDILGKGVDLVRTTAVTLNNRNHD